MNSADYELKYPELNSIRLRDLLAGDIIDDESEGYLRYHDLTPVQRASALAVAATDSCSAIRSIKRFAMGLLDAHRDAKRHRDKT